MLISKKEFLTLEKELDELLNKKRPDIIERVKTARAFGDLSENDEYNTAKIDQGVLESRIKEIESVLKNAEVIKHKSSDVITMGSEIVALNQTTKKEMEFGMNIEIDGAIKITTQSALGEAFLGKKIGEVVNVKTPNGFVSYEIKSVK